jgi:hypothetical protein
MTKQAYKVVHPREHHSNHGLIKLLVEKVVQCEGRTWNEVMRAPSPDITPPRRETSSTTPPRDSGIVTLEVEATKTL